MTDSRSYLKIQDGKVCTGIKPSGCKLKDIVIPEGIEVIGEEAFAYHRHLESVKFPSTLKQIGASAFTETSIREVHIPSSVLLVLRHAFADCKNLTKLVLDSEETTKRMFRSSFVLTPIHELIIGGMSYPVITRAEGYPMSLYLDNGIIKSAQSMSEASLKAVKKAQVWLDAFMEVPVEHILDSSKLPLLGGPPQDMVETVIGLRLKGLI